MPTVVFSSGESTAGAMRRVLIALLEFHSSLRPSNLNPGLMSSLHKLLRQWWKALSIDALVLRAMPVL